VIKGEENYYAPDRRLPYTRGRDGRLERPATRY